MSALSFPEKPKGNLFMDRALQHLSSVDAPQGLDHRTIDRSRSGWINRSIDMLPQSGLSPLITRCQFTQVNKTWFPLRHDDLEARSVSLSDHQRPHWAYLVCPDGMTVTRVLIEIGGLIAGRGRRHR